MNMQLIMYELDDENRKVYAHPAYYGFLNKVDGHVWTWTDTQARKEMINQHLKPYHGRVCELSFYRCVFEFHTEEDLTQFVITWS